MQVTFDSQPAPGQTVNEDIAVAGPRFAFVLDGATAPPGVDSGCEHTVAWYVTRLGGELSRLLVKDDSTGLPDTLAAAITAVCRLHSITCDLTNPDSPSATVAIVRETPTTVDHLVLADSPIVVRTADGQVLPIRDDRADSLTAEAHEVARAHRNVEGGFWVASTSPAAAHEAVTGSRPIETVASAGIFSDGASRLAERHGLSWADLLELLDDQGPSRLIAQVREADESVAPGAVPGKRHDDATAVLCRF
jgi:hypothetical protein